MSCRAASKPSTIRSSSCRGRPVVIVLDTYERWRLIDRWVREELVPALPSGAKLVLAGRDAPLLAWSLSAPRKKATASASASRRAIGAKSSGAGAGLAGDAAERLGRLSRGHPLTLRLAAAAALCAAAARHRRAGGAGRVRSADAPHEGSNIIEAAIGSLRRKLGGEAQRLETVRGVGYRLRAG
jgi:hypothetical protein